MFHLQLQSVVASVKKVVPGVFRYCFGDGVTGMVMSFYASAVRWNGRDAYHNGLLLIPQKLPRPCRKKQSHGT